ncbi:MAG: hypothetical protein EZS28_016234, partial [Streblomastix strix]
MSNPSQYFEVIADYAGIEGNTKYIPVMKGDVVRLIKKKHKYFKVEKDGRIGKIYGPYVLPDPIFNNIENSVIKTPNALHSLCTLTCYKINIHFRQENDQQAYQIRDRSRRCLHDIQKRGDASAHTKLVNANYARVLVIAISTASGSGEEKDEEIWIGLSSIFQFFSNLNKGKQYNPIFPPQPLLARRSVEQIEEEGGNEEIEAQLINIRGKWDIKVWVNRATGYL